MIDAHHQAVVAHTEHAQAIAVHSECRCLALGGPWFQQRATDYLVRRNSAGARHNRRTPAQHDIRAIPGGHDNPVCC